MPQGSADSSHEAAPDSQCALKSTNGVAAIAARRARSPKIERILDARKGTLNDRVRLDKAEGEFAGV
jgi:hypothetical protein